MDTTEITKFDDLHQLVVANRKGHFIYRGEDSAEYKLRPKFGRDKSCTLDKCLEVERSLLTSFMRRGAPHVGVMPGNEWEWLAVAQHFGLATRLLDWTENPLVAAYFATSPNHRRATDRVIYCLDQTEIGDADEQMSPFSIDEVTMYEPKHIATRIMAQTGLFTAHPNPGNIFASKSLQRWVVKGEAVLDLFVSLNRYGFHEASMFPGLDGLASHVNLWHMRGPRDD